MNIIVVAKDNDTLSEISPVVKKAFSNDSVETFTDPLMSIKYGASNKIDLAVLTTDLRRMPGARFGGILRDKYPDVRLVLVADDEGELKNAEHLPNSRHICRPITADAEDMDNP